jgi:hypothetical protein
MKNWLVIGILVVLIIIVVLVITGLKNLGHLIKTAVNRYGPDITKTEVKSGDVRISLSFAKAELMDFYLGNPAEFTSPMAMRVGSILVNVDKSSLMRRTIIINRIELIAPEIYYEKIRGSDNFKAILNNIKISIGADKHLSKDPAGKIKDGKKIFIKDFIVNDGRINLVTAVLGGKAISVPLPDIHLKDLGKDKDGSSPSEISNEIFSALYEKLTESVVSDILNKGLQFNGLSLETINDKVKKGVEVVMDKWKGYLEP